MSLVHNVILQSCVKKLQDWKGCHFEKLPIWMKNNEFLHFGHRPELSNFAECFQSIFRIHTETGNIWTHLIGFVAFVVATIVFYINPLCEKCQTDIQVLSGFGQLGF
jgi:adiponectin receptor